MKIKSASIATSVLLAFYALTASPGMLYAQSTNVRAAESPAVLTRDQAAALLPPSVFFRGQTASIQARNSAGLRVAGDKLVLMALVDTSGYSSALQETYQAYLLTEIPLTIAGQRLQPGAYGFGFIAGNKMVVMDIGGNEVLRVATTRDDALTRPTPLQILANAAAGTRLYIGRNYVPISPAER
jgi:hypothetical protein